MKMYLMLSLFLCVGCNGLDRLQGGRQDRDGGYDTSPIPGARIEPYAVLDGYQPDGGRLFLVHWTGNSLDNANETELEVDHQGIPKVLQ